MQHGFQDAVNDQVGIAANGRGEMGVGRGSQGEVAFVLLRVARLLQRAQHQVRKDALLRLAGNLLGQLLVHAGGDVHLFGQLDFPRALASAVAGAAVSLELEALHRQSAYSQGVAKGGGNGFELVNPLGIGLLVNAVERGNALVLEVVGHTLVGREHDFLDQPVGDVALGTRNTAHQAELVELNHRLRQVEIDRAAALALAVKDQGQIAHQLEFAGQPLVALAHARVAFQDQVHVGVGHALGGANDPRVEPVAENLTLVVNFHGAGHHQPVQVRAQAADIGGEFDGQHGHGAVGKVDRVAAQAGLPVKPRVLGHVVGDIGNVHLQLEVAVVQPAHDHGIIKVAGGFAVNGDNGQGAVVAPLLQFAGGNDVFHRLGFLQHLAGEAVRQVMLADDDFHVHAKIVFIAQDFEDAALRVLRGCRPFRNLNVNYNSFQVLPGDSAVLHLLANDPVDLLTLPLFSPLPFLYVLRGYVFRAFHSPRNDHIQGDLLVHGAHVVVARAVVEGADHGGMGASQHAQDSAFGAAIGANGGNFHQHAIAVHGRTDGARRNVDVAADALPHFIVLRDHKTVTVAVHGQASGQGVLAFRSLRNRVTVPIGLHQFAARHQLPQAFRQLTAVIAAHSQLADQLLIAGRVPRLALNFLQNGRVGKHGHGALEEAPAEPVRRPQALGLAPT